MIVYPLKVLEKFRVGWGGVGGWVGWPVGWGGLFNYSVTLVQTGSQELGVRSLMLGVRS